MTDDKRQAAEQLCEQIAARLATDASWVRRWRRIRRASNIMPQLVPDKIRLDEARLVIRRLLAEPDDD